MKAGASAGRMPAIYLSHGAPPLADDALWTSQLADWSAGLPRPASVLMVSAHWESAPLAIGAVTHATGSQRIGIAMSLVFLIAGLLLLLRVKHDGR